MHPWRPATDPNLDGTIADLKAQEACYDWSATRPEPVAAFYSCWRQARAAAYHEAFRDVPAGAHHPSGLRRALRAEARRIAGWAATFRAGRERAETAA